MIGILSNYYLDSEFCQSEWAAKSPSKIFGERFNHVYHSHSGRLEKGLGW